MGGADFAGFWHVVATDKARVGYAVVMRAELAPGDEGAVVKHCCYALYLRRQRHLTFVRADCRKG